MSNVHPETDLQVIERIVREVVSRLANADAQVAQGERTTKTEIPTGALSLDQKVISIATLSGKLENVTQLRLQPKAVITPAARDELRDNGIEIKFDQAASVVADRPKLILAVTGEANAQQFKQRLSQSGMAVELQQDARVSRLVASITGRFSTKTRVIVLTEEPYTATCVANRNPIVRAAVVRDETELQVVKKEINPNVIVIPANREAILELAAKELVG